MHGAGVWTPAELCSLCVPLTSHSKVCICLILHKDGGIWEEEEEKEESKDSIFVLWNEAAGVGADDFWLWNSTEQMKMAEIGWLKMKTGGACSTLVVGWRNCYYGCFFMMCDLEIQ